jgi:hypothetical protein
MIQWKGWEDCHDGPSNPPSHITPKLNMSCLVARYLYEERTTIPTLPTPAPSSVITPIIDFRLNALDRTEGLERLGRWSGHLNILAHSDDGTGLNGVPLFKSASRVCPDCTYARSERIEDAADF